MLIVIMMWLCLCRLINVSVNLVFSSVENVMIIVFVGIVVCGVSVLVVFLNFFLVLSMVLSI